MKLAVIVIVAFIVIAADALPAEPQQEVVSKIIDVLTVPESVQADESQLTREKRQFGGGES